MQPAGVRYRPATPRDAIAVAAVVGAGFATYRSFAPPGWQPRNPLREEGEVYDRLSRGETRARLALDGAIAVGVTGWMPARTRDVPPQPIEGRAHLWLLFVVPEHWGTGLARELLAWSTEGMRESGFDEAQLWTPRDSARARAFYEREGWRPAAEEMFSSELGLALVRYERAL